MRCSGLKTSAIYKILDEYNITELHKYSWNISVRTYSASKWEKYIPSKFPGHILSQPENQVILFLTS